MMPIDHSSRYACTSGRRKRRYNFLSKKKKEMMSSQAAEHGKKMGKLIYVVGRLVED
jgi:hypothetical protein